MKYINKTKIIIITFITVLLSACEGFLDINVDPNNPSEASLEMLLPAAQVSMGFYMASELNNGASVYIQHYYGLALSTYSQTGATYTNDWEELYTGALKDLDEVQQAGEAQNLPFYTGIAKLQKAYIFSVLTDLFGDIPFSEALNENIMSPKFDKGEDIYTGLLAMIDAGIADLNKPGSNITAGAADLIYQSNRTHWKRFGKTLKLKLYNQMRLVDPLEATNKINALIAEDSLIVANSMDFQFEFSSGQSPLNRHPLYQLHYQNSKTYYMSNYLMASMLDKNDPRLRYYIYRQSLDDPDHEDMPCADRNDCPVGYVGLGYIGRDHGDPSGLPNDNAIRSTFGVYPVGGSFDAGSRSAREINSGTGAGISPMLTNFMRAFILAEASLTLNTSGDARAYFEEGIKASLNKVRAFGLANDKSGIETYEETANTPWATLADNYVNARLAEFDAASSNEDKLKIVMYEKHIACFGNGIESYIDFRRTKMPDLPRSIAPVGPFPRRLPYPNTELTANGNSPKAVSVSVPVFWDKGE